MSVYIKKNVLEHLPDSKAYNGTISATSIHYDINPVIILEEHANNKGPGLELAIDYYGPSAAARMGLPVDKVRYIVKSPGAFDPEYLEVWLPALIKDSWGHLHAGDGTVTWGELNADQLCKILSEIGEKPTKHIGKLGVFVGDDRIVKRYTINGYNGIQYIDVDGELINGELLRLETNGDEKFH